MQCLILGARYTAPRIRYVVVNYLLYANSMAIILKEVTTKVPQRCTIRRFYNKLSCLASCTRMKEGERGVKHVLRFLTVAETKIVLRARPQ